MLLMYRLDQIEVFTVHFTEVVSSVFVQRDWFGWIWTRDYSCLFSEQLSKVFLRFQSEPCLY